MVSPAPLDPRLLELLAAAFSLRGQAPAQGADPFEQAFGDTPRVERCGWDEHRDQTREVIEGRAAVRRWLGLAPVDTRFAIGSASAASRTGLPAVRFVVTVGDFRNEGTWELGIGADARIDVLVHRPDSLPPPDLAALQRGHRSE